MNRFTAGAGGGEATGPSVCPAVYMQTLDWTK